MSQRIAKVLADKGDREALVALIGQAFEPRKVEVEISQRPEGAKGFQVEPKRSIVERTWSGLENARILTRDDERLPENHEGIVYGVMIRLRLRRLTESRRTWQAKTTQSSFTNTLLGYLTPMEFENQWKEQQKEEKGTIAE